MHSAVFGGDSAAWAATQAIRVEALRHIGETGIRALLDSSLAAGTVAEQNMTDLVDWILRILISYAAVPGHGGRQPDEVRRQLATWFLPAFDRNILAGQTATADSSEPTEGFGAMCANGPAVSLGPIERVRRSLKSVTSIVRDRTDLRW